MDVKIKNRTMTLPKTKLDKLKGKNKFLYLMFVPSRYSKLLSDAGMSKATCEKLVQHSNVYCVLLTKSQLISFMQHNLNSLANTETSDAILNNISISETNSFKIPDAYSSFFSVGDFILSGNEVWEKDTLERVNNYSKEAKKGLTL